MKFWTLLAFVGLHWPFWPLWPWIKILSRKYVELNWGWIMPEQKCEKQKICGWNSGFAFFATSFPFNGLKKSIVCDTTYLLFVVFDYVTFFVKRLLTKVLRKKSCSAKFSYSGCGWTKLFPDLSWASDHLIM